ncbi:unnamed protein product, partial [Mesorhabditis belari]|uniref:HTH OST-type domain-containing protein n=1 Tax=Mesorhabditis belari TaxID=2138241 RepID=A0AAF3FJ79_9BILA
MDEQLTKVHKDIYAIVASVQGGCQASKILHEYRQNYGMLDFRKFGHKNLNEFLATVPKIFVSRNAIGETLYKAKLADSEAARDIQFQVSMQKAPDRVKTQNFKRSHSTRGQLPQTFQRQTRQRSSYGAAFATQSSHDNQNRTLHGFKKDYVSSWVRTSTPIEDPNGQKPIPLLDEVSTYNRIHNGFVQDRNFAPQLYPRQLPSFKQNYDNRSVQHSHSTWSNHSGRFSQHSQQDLGEKSRNNSNPYRQKANQAAAAAVPQTEAPRVSKTSQLLQDKEIKAECETLSITSGRSSPKGVALFNWGKKSKQEIPETPETPNTKNRSV